MISKTNGKRRVHGQRGRRSLGFDLLEGKIVLDGGGGAVAALPVSILVAVIPQAPQAASNTVIQTPTVTTTTSPTTSTTADNPAPTAPPLPPIPQGPPIVMPPNIAPAPAPVTAYPAPVINTVMINGQLVTLTTIPAITVTPATANAGTYVTVNSTTDNGTQVVTIISATLNPNGTVSSTQTSFDMTQPGTGNRTVTTINPMPNGGTIIMVQQVTPVGSTPVPTSANLAAVLTAPAVTVTTVTTYDGLGNVVSVVTMTSAPAASPSGAPQGTPGSGQPTP